MTEQLIDFGTAKLAKAKGFDEECMHYWEWYEGIAGGKALAHAKPIMDFREVDSGLWERAQQRPGLYNQIYCPMKNSATKPWLYARPTQDLLERWLREVQFLSVGVYVYEDQTWQWIIQKIGTRKEHSVLPDDISGKPGSHPSYELAKEAALQQALKLLPDKL